MRRLIVLVVFIVAIPLARALTIFGETVSTLVLIPLILILISLFAFVFMIIRDKIRSRSAGPAEELRGMVDLPPIEDLNLPSNEEIPPVETAGKKEAPAEKAASQKQNPKRDYLEEVKHLEEELPSMGMEEANKKLNELVKAFFFDYLGVGYNFTFEELEKELKKSNRKIMCFSDNLSYVNYSPEGASRENLVQLIKEFKDVVVSSKRENQLITPEFKKEMEKEEKRINKLLKEGNKLIGKDINKAREKYNEVFELYNLLPDKEKETARKPIMDFYNRLGYNNPGL